MNLKICFGVAIYVHFFNIHISFYTYQQMENKPQKEKEYEEKKNIAFDVKIHRSCIKKASQERENRTILTKGVAEGQRKF